MNIIENNSYFSLQIRRKQNGAKRYFPVSVAFSAV